MEKDKQDILRYVTTQLIGPGESCIYMGKEKQDILRYVTTQLIGPGQSCIYMGKEKQDILRYVTTQLSALSTLWFFLCLRKLVGFYS